MTVRLLAALAALLTAGTALGADSGTDWDARLDLRPTYQDVRSPASTAPVFRQRAIGLIRAGATDDGITVRTQLRPEAARDDRLGEARVHLDEAYVRVAAGPSLFAEVGKRQIVNGVTLGFNPTDVWAEGKVVDRSVDDETRRAEREGDVVAGLAWYGDGTAVQSYVAPRRWSLGTSWTLADQDADAGVLLSGGDRPALGFTLSATLTDALVAYTETALRTRRDRDPDGRGLYADAVAGSQYTFGNGVNLAVELYHHGEGYSDAEMDRIFARGQTRMLATAAGRPLRRNYLFARLADIPTWGSAKLQVTLIRNLDDRGHVLRTLLDLPLGDRDRVTAVADLLDGPSRSEYGLSPVGARVVVSYRHHF